MALPYSINFMNGLLKNGQQIYNNGKRICGESRYSYQKMLSMLKPLSKAEIIQQMRIAYEYFIVENKDVDFLFPVLILVGQKDRTCKVKTYCKECAKQTGYPLHFIKQAKHFANGDNPEQVNKEIEKFIIETIHQERENYAVL